MSLDSSLSVTLSDGTVISAAQFDPVFFDHAARKLTLVRLHPALRPLPLWRGFEYDAIGDWTQAQADARIAELLGNNPQEFLQGLVVS